MLQARRYGTVVCEGGTDIEMLIPYLKMAYHAANCDKKKRIKRWMNLTVNNLLEGNHGRLEQPHHHRVLLVRAKIYLIIIFFINQKIYYIAFYTYNTGFFLSEPRLT